MTLLRDRLIDAHAAYYNADSDLTDAVLRALGVDPKDVDAWPFEDTTWDWHDNSIELKHVTPGFRILPEQCEAIWATGFSLVFVCYSDGTERTYRKGREPIESEVRPAHGGRHDHWEDRVARAWRAQAAEREACAKIADEHELTAGNCDPSTVKARIAAQIRAR